MYLTDLTFIEDGIPSIIKKTNLINFAKRAKTAEVIRDIQQYQNAPYSLQPVPELQDYILSNMQAAGDVHEMYDKSLVVEPREREDEKIVRYVTLTAPPHCVSGQSRLTLVVATGCSLNQASCEGLNPGLLSTSQLWLGGNSIAVPRCPLETAIRGRARRCRFSACDITQLSGNRVAHG